ncbi:Dolichyl-diphosphooligosaccharide--protein glycosyltransferase subunit WBP1 [Nakaseomyces bracarensis]|uniref:Dolichyl-diphosphooligosaccharide--protein glycosyltransferase subunit WBP1 n=1 Tax=Nakaseomyces bracarensis TaxID=273131 RepID=A0ABR4NME2_9SACH
MMKLYIINFILALVAFVNGISVTGNRTLVVYDDRYAKLDDYSNYFDSLKERFEVDFVEVSDKGTQVELTDGLERSYDNLLVFPVKTKALNKRVSAQKLLDFMEQGGNVMTVHSPETATESVRVFWTQLGVHPATKGYELVNDFTKGELDTPLESLNNDVFPKNSAGKKLVIGKAATALLGANEFIVPVLQAERVSQCVKADRKRWSAGPEGYLAVGFQNAINARALWIGSADAFLNSNYESNKEFLNEISKWVFNEKAVIKVVNVAHQHIDGTTYEERPYKVTDNISYEIALSEWNGKQWVPFERNDVQFELRQIDPYYRITMKAVRGGDKAVIYSTGDFKLPDRHGMFTFLTDYKRPGLSYIHESDVRAIRHLANDEYPRSWTITNSWVYLSAIYGVICVWIVFVILFVVTGKKQAAVTTKKQAAATEKKNE